MFHALSNLQLQFNTDNNIRINRFFQLNLEDFLNIEITNT